MTFTVTRTGKALKSLTVFTICISYINVAARRICFSVYTAFKT